MADDEEYYTYYYHYDHDNHFTQFEKDIIDQNQLHLFAHFTNNKLMSVVYYSIRNNDNHVSLQFCIEKLAPSTSQLTNILIKVLFSPANNCFKYFLNSHSEIVINFVKENNINKFEKLNEESLVLFTKIVNEANIFEEIDVIDTLLTFCFKGEVFHTLFQLIEDIVINRSPDCILALSKHVIKHSLTKSLHRILNSNVNFDFVDLFILTSSKNNFDHYLIIKEYYLSNIKSLTKEKKKHLFITFLNKFIKRYLFHFVQDLLNSENDFLDGENLSPQYIIHIGNRLLTMFTEISERHKDIWITHTPTKDKIKIFNLVQNHYNITFKEDRVWYCVKYPIVPLILPFVFGIDIEEYFSLEDYSLTKFDNYPIKISLKEDLIIRLIRFINPETNYIVKRMLLNTEVNRERLIAYQLFCLDIVNQELFKFIHDQWNIHSSIIYERIEIFNAGYTTFTVSDNQRFTNMYQEDPEWWNTYLLYCDPNLYSVGDTIESYREDKRRWTNEACKLVNITKDLRAIIQEYI